jgi:hypothetical protein
LQAENLRPAGRQGSRNQILPHESKTTIVIPDSPNRQKQKAYADAQAEQFKILKIY